ncbi:putative deoxyribonuclease RhsC [compost metagenome]
MPIAAVIDGATYAVHSDHLNTPRRLTNADGQAVWQWGYSAFGEDKPTTARNRFADLDVTPNPGTTGVSEVKFNLRYPGQYADEESGLFYNYFRSYDARTGRYNQGDPLGLAGGGNRFNYVDGNPLAFSDPLGLFRVDGTPPEGLNPYQQREWDRMVKSLNDLGDRFQARINKACFVDRAKLQALFDAWVVKVDPRVFELRRNRSDYADTKNSRSTFYSGFFRDGDAYVSPASPGQPFTFAHEFRHMSPSNIAKGSANTTTKNRIFGQGAPDPAELDADQFAEAFWGTCPCGISN